MTTVDTMMGSVGTTGSKGHEGDRHTDVGITIGAIERKSIVAVVVGMTQPHGLRGRHRGENELTFRAKHVRSSHVKGSWGVSHVHAAQGHSLKLIHYSSVIVGPWDGQVGVKPSPGLTGEIGRRDISVFHFGCRLRMINFGSSAVERSQPIEIEDVVRSRWNLRDRYFRWS